MSATPAQHMPVVSEDDLRRAAAAISGPSAAAEALRSGERARARGFRPLYLRETERSLLVVPLRQALASDVVAVDARVEADGTVTILQTYIPDEPAPAAPRF